MGINMCSVGNNKINVVVWDREDTGEHHTRSESKYKYIGKLV